MLLASRARLLVLPAQSQLQMYLCLQMKRIVNKHMQARFHSILAYNLSVTVVSLPLAALDTIIFGTLVYWMTNFDHDFPRFLFYLLIIFLVGITFNSFFRVIAFLSPSLVRKHSTIVIIGLQCPS